MPDLPTGTVTFLFTDIEASTQLLQSMPEQTYADLLNTHHAILRSALTEWHGREMDTQGDALFAVFPRAADAVSAAITAQRAFADHSRAAGVELRVRMGLHTGEATLNPTGYVGIDVHRAARISQIGHGGQVLLSDSTVALVHNELPSGVSLRDLGTHRLKDLQGLEHISQLVIPGLVSDFPPLTSLNAVANNLPVQLTDFIGRENEIQELKRRLCPELDPARRNGHGARLLTLTGTGGTGKTRLALQVAADLLTEFPDGVWLVELAPLADPALIPQAIASALGVREQPGRPLLDSVVDSLRAKNSLLILDNCEHLIDQAAQIANTLLRAAPGLKILATSREGLGIDGETSYRVPSLSLPKPRAKTVEDLVQCESAQLFLMRAAAVQPRFQVTEQNAPSVAQIVRRLDGIPLAIELAAARCKLFSPEQIAARLDDHFRLLTGGSRTALPRQQTLRALIDWSYDLLSKDECTLLRRLAVFVGGCTYDAVEVVAGEGLDVLEVLEHLVDKSLVIVEEQETTTRYRLLEMIRQYGRDKLFESGEGEAVRNRHLDYYTNVVMRDMVYPFTPLNLEQYRMYRAEQDNLRAAMAWGLESKSIQMLEIAGRLPAYWSRAGLMSEAIDWLEGALAGFDDLSGPGDRTERERTRARAFGLHALGYTRFLQGSSVPARAEMQQSLDLFRELGDAVNTALNLATLGLVDRFLGNDEQCLLETAESEALLRRSGHKMPLILVLTVRTRFAGEVTHDLLTGRRLAEEAIALARTYDNPWLLGMPLVALGMISFFNGDYEGARRALVESMETFRKQEDFHGCNISRGILADIERVHGDLEQAVHFYHEVIPVWQQMGHSGGLARTFECLAFVASAEAQKTGGDERAALLNRAAQLLGAAEVLRASSGAVMLPEEQVEFEREVAALRGQMGAEALDQEWAAGRALPLEQAIALARAG